MLNNLSCTLCFNVEFFTITSIDYRSTEIIWEERKENEIFPLMTKFYAFFRLSPRGVSTSEDCDDFMRNVMKSFWLFFAGFYEILTLDWFLGISTEFVQKKIDFLVGFYGNKNNPSYGFIHIVPGKFQIIYNKTCKIWLWELIISSEPKIMDSICSMM